MNEPMLKDTRPKDGFAVIVLDPKGRIESANLVAARLFLYPEDEDGAALEGLIVEDILPHVTLKDLLRHVGPDQRSAVLGAVPGRGFDGEKIELTVQVTPWTDPAGRLRVTLILRTTAAPSLTATELERELALSNAAVRGAGIGVFEYRPGTDSVTVSEIWRELVEIPADDPVDVQVEWRRRVHPDDLATALEPVRACLEDEVERASCEYRLRTRDRRRWRWMRTDISVLERDAQGKVTRLIGAMSNISEQKAVENALRHSVEQFRSAFEHATIGKAIVTRHGSFLRVNQSLCDMLGFTPEQMQRTDFQSLTHPDDLDADLAQLRALTEGKVASYQMEKRFLRANGSIMWGQLSLGLVRDAEGNPEQFIAQIVDVTEQHRLAELKSEFVATVSHELRTPLTSVLGALGLLNAMDTEKLPDSAQRLLFIAQQNGQRLLTLINDILDFEKFSARQMRYALEQHRITGLVEESVMTNLALADRYGVRFEILSVDPLVSGFVDARRFQQVMANLLSNAAKFADTDSVIEIEISKEQSEIRIAVRNRGRGIPESFRDQVFTPFSQAELSSTRSRGGTGLGLAITRQIVEQTGGRIGFDSVPEGLTTFWFTVPIEEPTAMLEALAS